MWADGRPEVLRGTFADGPLIPLVDGLRATAP